MHIKDDQGYVVSGANARALDLYREANHLQQSWRADPLSHLSRAIEEAPAFVMAHLMQGYIYISGRELSNVWRARQCLERVTRLPMNDREQWHFAALRALTDSEHARAETILCEVLTRYPTDILALSVAHSFDYLLGNTQQLRDRVARQMSFWVPSMPGFGAVSTMYAFGLAEYRQYSEAAHWCARALELEPGSPRVHHAMAHVHELARSHEAGMRWMERHSHEWSASSQVAVHCWWHLALFHMHQDDLGSALRIYDRHMAPTPESRLGRAIDAASLLWRAHLKGLSVGERWSALADKWGPHISEGFCAFNDMHAMMAFVGASRWMATTALIQAQSFRAQEDDTNARMTREVGLPACQGILAYGLGRYDEAIERLAKLPADAVRLGGSHAQYSVISLTLQAAKQRRAKSTAPVPIAA